MTRLIDADALERAIYEWMPKDQETWMDSDIPPIENLVVSIMMTIQEQPPVDAEPVRYGKWKDHKDYPGLAYLCSECGCFTTMRTYRYCPYCGAVMRGYENGGHI